MRSRLAEAGALAMRLSLLSFVAPPFSMSLKRTPKFHYHRRAEASTTTSRRAGGRGVPRQSPRFAPAGSVQPQLRDVPRIRAQLIAFHAFDDISQYGVGVA